MNSLLLNVLIRRNPPVWLRYFIATAFMSLSSLAVWGLDSAGIYAPLLLLIPVVMLISLTLDRGSGLYSAGLSSIVAYVFPGAGPHGETLTGAQAWSSLFLFVGSVTLAAILIEALYRSAARVAASEREKDLLLREASHRIKNNLQTVVSLLRLQRRTLQSEDARAAIDTALARTNVMAMIHARLVGNNPRDLVDMNRFVSNLCGDLHKSIAGERPISLSIDAESIMFDCSRAVSIGLIINELVTNALKYAFPTEMGGTIAIAFAGNADGYRLDVADDGVGVAPDARSGLGQTLTQLLARQLGGSIERMEEGPGTCHRLRFPAAGRAARG
jgi:two-component sensor histidine kinase